jgi:hypothetical protein
MLQKKENPQKPATKKKRKTKKTKTKNPKIPPPGEDMEDGTLDSGEQCWSTCQGQCPSSVF